ncbi:6-phosphogluconate dehydrogenase family protein [Artemisia annua]|uniref:6-phosphogluconate dehydrogenase family protein n=1 Tax=Artemisia annua TaxID=35608 RepID=A0A2U1NY62_ARTAN|nr:6-phosphogluconate dehydrogenase family protein [Artemisia annua]
MVGNIEGMMPSLYSNGAITISNGLEDKLDEFRRVLGKSDDDLLKIVGVGAGAWGSVFAALLQDSYGRFRDKVQIRIWRRGGRAVDRATAEHLFEVINSREDVLRRLIRRCAYLKYVEARLGMVASLTNESATSKSVYFAHCTSEMIFITYLLTEEPEKLAGPLLADTYVTLLKGRNAWYGQMIAKGELSLDMGDSITGKGMIQGVSAVGAFFELLSQSSLSVLHPNEKKSVAPVELCPILKTLYKILIKREKDSRAILEALRDERLNDPRERIEIAQSHAFYKPSLLGQP